MWSLLPRSLESEQNRFQTGTQREEAACVAEGTGYKSEAKRNLVVLRTWKRTPGAEMLRDREKRPRFCRPVSWWRGLDFTWRPAQSGEDFKPWAARFMFFKITLAALLKQEEEEKDGRETGIILSFTYSFVWLRFKKIFLSLSFISHLQFPNDPFWMSFLLFCCPILCIF